MIRRMLVCAMLFASSQTYAADLSFTLLDKKEKLVDFAVVTLTPLFEGANIPQARQEANMQQQNIMFAPFVLPVRLGSEVGFPNRDDIRHHVYSFSKPKRFELKLYSNSETRSETFDKPGPVALGCNIHDNMLAYIYVTEAPIFDVSDEDGTIKFSGLTPGEYELKIWHPDMRRSALNNVEKITVKNGAEEKTMTVNLKSSRRRQQEASEAARYF